MIRHLILFKLNEGVERDDPRVMKGVDALRALDGSIKEIRSCELGWNFTDRPIAYDFAANFAFDDVDALHTYFDHPGHQAGVALWREIATWIIADYEF
ncbi:Dabb family protein [Streptomyces europaeiscabiei]|uniref:Dabb family protein n=1 Tax=Streptomyces TaxID=1883 RepID=UPI000A3A8E5D|nr:MULTISPECIES: Dabb family protein [Streptomyces]MDX3631190.1 Dabb family protein [Streptomyces europaeiscabiei]MDX3647670.1 Dabb family protein [Streptomyces europaeiscabiei]WUD32354.1 Dabb family protein [Streptomyces europaeiscabiei]